MKGFIEVTDAFEMKKVTINISNIRRFTESNMLGDTITEITTGDFPVEAIESYSEIKELIKQATEL